MLGFGMRSWRYSMLVNDGKIEKMFVEPLRIMDIIEASGTGFAFPSQTLFLGRDEAPAKQRAGEIADEVRAWRERNELYLPAFRRLGSRRSRTRSGSLLRDHRTTEPADARAGAPGSEVERRRAASTYCSRSSGS